MTPELPRNEVPSSSSSYPKKKKYKAREEKRCDWAMVSRKKHRCFGELLMWMLIIEVKNFYIKIFGHIFEVTGNGCES